MAQKPTTKSVTEEIYLGDEVTLHDTKRGIVRFIGPMDDKNVPTFYGIELKSGVGKNDGTSSGHKFFECGPNKGVFTTKMKISRTKPTAESKQFPHATAGTHVNVPSKKAHGVVRYIGHVSFDEGLWIGVELDEPHGDNNGTVKERSYFKCKDNHGIFVRSDGIEIVEEKKSPAAKAGASASPAKKQATSAVSSNSSKKSPASKTTSAASKDKSQQAKTGKPVPAAAGADKSKTSTSKTAAKPSPSKVGATAAASGAKKAATKNPPSKKTATTADKSKASKEATENHKDHSEVTAEEEKENFQEVNVGDKVVIKPDKMGQVKYIGEANNIGPGIWYGVRLVDKKGECDGEFRGHEFFQCPQGFGVYVQQHSIVRKLNAEESGHFDFMEEEKSIEALKDFRLKHIQTEREKLQAVIQKFKELDTDGNQVLDRQEFSKLAIETMQCDPRAARELFATVDHNGSGHISLAEFKMWVESIGGIESITKLNESQDNAVEATESHDNAVETTESHDNAVETTGSQDNAVEATESQDNAVETTGSQDNAVEATESQDNNAETTEPHASYDTNPEHNSDAHATETKTDSDAPVHVDTEHSVAESDEKAQDAAEQHYGEEIITKEETVIIKEESKNEESQNQNEKENETIENNEINENIENNENNENNEKGEEL